MSDARNATSSARNIASAPTRRPVRVLRSRRSMYGTINPVPEISPPMTAEDLYDFRFLADAQISPDGVRIAYVVRTIDREKNTYRSSIWSIPFDGSAPGTRLTAGPGQDALPRWSPDGRLLAFLSDRSAKTDDPKNRKPKNVFVLSLDGGEARQLTTGEDDCADIAWSPNGARLAFT